MPARSLLLARLCLPLILAGLAGAVAGCPAVYPELGTRTRPFVAGVVLDPPPPEGVYWLRAISAHVPERNRGGRPWQTNGNKADPYAKILVNDKELLRTPVESNTLDPTWPKGPRGNFKIAKEDRLSIELWDSNPLNDKPICVDDVGHITDDMRQEKRIRIHCEGGAEMMVAFEDAHPVLGAGLWYELRTDSAYVTRMLQDSPAERAGLRAGDEIVSINGRKVQQMTSDEVRSIFTAIPVAGLTLELKHPDGTSLSASLKEGPIYPLFNEFGPID